jgi:hypothetical protein
MRFMMIMIPRVYQPETPFEERAKEGFTPSEEDVDEMSKYNEELIKADALISLDGVRPLTEGARVSFSKGNVRVTDGPDIVAKEVFGGYWIIDVDSKEEAVNWAKKVPAKDGDVIEIRQIFEL